MAGDRHQITVAGHRVSVSSLGKVLYPQTGTTKSDVLQYFATAAAAMIPHLEGRPVTRKRWPDGVQGQSFFAKDLTGTVPDWVQRGRIEHRSRTVSYPVVDSAATLIWLGQGAALELHVPQWRFGPNGKPADPDRIVFDLDPGPGMGLAECAQVARAIRDLLGPHSARLVPVTSGSKGLHLYLPLEASMTSSQAADWARQVADAVQARMPGLVVSQMSKSLRDGRIFIDWSQNNAAKTTIAPYSLRGRERPTVAAPRTWEELEDPNLRHLEYTEMPDRLDDLGDLMGASARQDSSDRLRTYRAMRDSGRTPEPVPAAGSAVWPSAGSLTGSLAGGDNDIFVIQEHHARRLHWDFRLERDGVLVSWAVPKGMPTDPGHNRLAVQTEDHPLEYATFAGSIPKGEYGGGTVQLWDTGRYRTEKWRPDEVIVELTGSRVTGRFALIRTGGSNWLLHRMKSDGVPDREADIAPSGGVPDAPVVPGSDAPAVLESDVPAVPGPDAEAVPGAGVDVGGALPVTVRRSRPRVGRDAEAPPATVTTDEAEHQRAGSPDARWEIVPPMLATAGTVAALTADQTWRLEGKWDGIRAVAYVGCGPLKLLSRNGNDITAAYPELAELAAVVAGHSAILDGEIVADGRGGIPDFGLLQQRMGLTQPRDVIAARASVPVRYLAFDLLWLDGISLLRKTYDDRRRLLDALGVSGDFIATPAQLAGSPAQALAASARGKLEGVVAKRDDSAYLPGRRSGSWIKIKHRSAQEVVIVGWRPGAGRRAGGIGSLLVAVPVGEQLHYVGRVGTGFTDAMLDRLAGQLKPLARANAARVIDVPAADATGAVWVTPSLVGEVLHAGWTADRRLRHATWRGLRPDKSPGQVTSEE